VHGDRCRLAPITSRQTCFGSDLGMNWQVLKCPPAYIFSICSPTMAPHENLQLLETGNRLPVRQTVACFCRRGSDSMMKD